MKPLFAFLAVTLFTPVVFAQSLTDSSLEIENIITAGSISQPTNMAFIGDDDILVNEKATGRVRRVIDGVVQSGSVLDLPVNSRSERGLLGMALDPGFPDVPHVYLFYTVDSSDNTGETAIANRVSRYTWNGTALVDGTLVINLPVMGGPNHDGGILVFGPPNLPAAEQKLFVVIGDLNRIGQTVNNASGAAPDDTAVIIRINRDGSTPTDGPFYDVAGSNEALQRMYAYGVRNSYGMDFDPVSNVLWDTENGPNSNDEINRIEPGFNSGWTTIMGPAPSPLPSLVTFSGVGTYADPVFTWERIVAPTAIHFLRSTALGPDYSDNDCIVASNNPGKLYRFRLNDTRTEFELSGDLADKVWSTGEDDSQAVIGVNFGPITDIRTGPDGFLYVLQLNPGRIFRISPVETSVNNWGLYE